MPSINEKLKPSTHKVCLQVKISRDAHTLVKSVSSLKRETMEQLIERLVFEEAAEMGLPLESLGISAS